MPWTETPTLTRRRLILASAATPALIAAYPLGAPAAAEAGQITRLFLDWIRRSDVFGDASRGSGEDVTQDQLNWLDEPVLEAMELEPETPSDWAALIFFGWRHGEDFHAAPIILERAARVLGLEA